MTSWKRVGRDALISGSAASLTSTGALLALGGVENDSPLGPINAISHWYWGERAAHRDDPSLPHTLFGYVTHHAASIFWALFYEKLFGARRRGRIGPRELSDAATIAALACFVDYRLTPSRFTPGYEKRLNRKSLFVVYAMFAVGLAVGGRLADAARRREMFG